MAFRAKLASEKAMDLSHNRLCSDHEGVTYPFSQSENFIFLVLKKTLLYHTVLSED